MNKTIYKVATVFNVMIQRKISANEEGCIICNTKYILASSDEEAINKYNDLFLKEYKCIPSIDEWDEVSSNIKEQLYKDIKIKSIKTLIINSDCKYVSIQKLINNMSAYDFKEWWNAYQMISIT